MLFPLNRTPSFPRLLAVFFLGTAGLARASSTNETPIINNISLAPQSVTGGADVTVSVEFSIAPSSGLAFYTASSNKKAVRVPAKVSLPAGATTATFSCRTFPVSTTTKVYIAARYGKSLRMTPLTVVPPTPAPTTTTSTPTLTTTAPTPLSAPVETLFSSPEGDDTTGDGSIDKPWKTLARAIQAVNAGSVQTIIALRGGTYNETGDVANRLKRSDVTIRSYPGEWAHVISPVDPTATKVTLWIDGTAKRPKIEDLEISGGYYAVKFNEGTTRSDVPGGIGTWIKRCRIHHTFADAIKIAGGAKDAPLWNDILPAATDVLIEECEIYATRQNGGTNGQGVDNVMGHRMVVRNCYLHDIPGDNGIAIKGGAEDCIVEGNLLRGMGSGIAVGQSTGDSFFDHLTNPKSYEAIRHIVRNNIILEMQHAGIQTWSSKDCTIYNNTLFDVARIGQGGFYLYDMDHYDWSAGDGTHVTWTVPCEGLQVRNNIVVLANASTCVGVSVREGAYRDDDKPVFSNNRYYHVGKTVRFLDIHRYPSGPNMVEESLAAWTAFVGSETGSIEGDPGLTGDYRLMPESLCIGAGYDTTSIVQTDIDGRLRTVPVDIGAYELSAM